MSLKYFRRVSVKDTDDIELCVLSNNELVDVWYAGSKGMDYRHLDELIIELNKSPNAKVVGREDGIYVCWGDHEGGPSAEVCEFQRIIPYTLDYINKQTLFKAVDKFKRWDGEVKELTKLKSRPVISDEYGQLDKKNAEEVLNDIWKNTPITFEKKKVDLTEYRIRIWVTTFESYMKQLSSHYTATAEANRAVQSFDNKFKK